MKKPVRFPTDEELLEFMEEAVPIAKKKASKGQMDLEPWMVTDAICHICPELSECDPVLLESAVDRLLLL